MVGHFWWWLSGGGGGGGVVVEATTSLLGWHTSVVVTRETWLSEQGALEGQTSCGHSW